MELNKQEETKTRKCRCCGREIYTGDEALGLQRVVIGLMRPVPLEEMLFFHSDECFQEYVCNNEGEKLPKRFP